MDMIQNIVITHIKPPMFVHSPKSNFYQKSNRSTYGLSFCQSGQITYYMDGKAFVSTPDCAVLLPKGGNYYLVGDEEGIFPLLNFECEGFSCDRITVIPISNTNSCLQDCKALQTLFLSPNNHARIFSLFYSLWDKVFQNQSYPNDLLHPAIRYMEEHLSDPNLSNSHLANAVSLSEVYFRKLFTQEYGISPRQYIIDLRIKMAQQLLRDNCQSITDISEACGFSSVYYFCRLFKQRTGLTPLQYVKQHYSFQI